MYVLRQKGLLNIKKKQDKGEDLSIQSQDLRH